MLELKIQGTVKLKISVTPGYAIKDREIQLRGWKGSGWYEE